MSGWLRHPQCYNQKACVLDHQYRRTEPVRVRGILCAPEHISQDTDTAKPITGSQGGGSAMGSSSGWVVSGAPCRTVGGRGWCLGVSRFFKKF